jgi:hypothetical protein
MAIGGYVIKTNLALFTLIVPWTSTAVAGNVARWIKKNVSACHFCILFLASVLIQQLFHNYQIDYNN